MSLPRLDCKKTTICSLSLLDQDAEGRGEQLPLRQLCREAHEVKELRSVNSPEWALMCISHLDSPQLLPHPPGQACRADKVAAAPSPVAELQPHRDFEPETTSKAALGFLTHRNCKRINACYFTFNFRMMLSPINNSGKLKKVKTLIIVTNYKCFIGIFFQNLPALIWIMTSFPRFTRNFLKESNGSSHLYVVGSIYFHRAGHFKGFWVGLLLRIKD